MISKIKALLIIFIIVAIAAGIIVLNLEPLTVFLVPGKKFTAVTGLVLLGFFCAGVATAAVFWIFSGIKAFLRERTLQNKDKKREGLYKMALQARSCFSAGEWKKSRQEWEKVIRKDPANVIARIELSRSLQDGGDIQEALKVLEAARAEDSTNTEVLFRAAEINVALGNKTAAVDNLALILYHHPNIKAARLARDLSEDLGRIEDALEYHNKLRELGEDDDALKESLTRLRFKKLLKDNDGKSAEDLKSALRVFVKKNPSFVQALHKLALLENQAGRMDESAKLLVQAARASGSRMYWREATRLWIDNNLSDRALSSARSAVRNTKGLPRLNAEMDLIRLQLALGNTDEAQKSLDGFDKLALVEDVETDEQTRLQVMILRGLCHNKQGQYREAAGVWTDLCDQRFEIKEEFARVNEPLTDSAPSPLLSTP